MANDKVPEAPLPWYGTASHGTAGGAGLEPPPYRITGDSQSHQARGMGGPDDQLWGMEEPPGSSGPEDTPLVSDPLQIRRAEEHTGLPLAPELWLVGGILRRSPEGRSQGAYLLCVHHPWIQWKQQARV